MVNVESCIRQNCSMNIRDEKNKSSNLNVRTNYHMNKRRRYQLPVHATIQYRTRQIKAPCMFRSQCTGTTHNQHTQHTIDTLLSTYHNCIRTTDQTTSMPKPIAKQTRTMTTHTHFQRLTPRHVTLSLKIRSMDSPQSLNIGSTISPGAKEALSGP